MKKTKFTLIELLVVIAIIAILASMLLPALQQARERGRATSCLSNMKSLYFGLSAYADNNKEYFPAALNSFVPPGTAKAQNYGWCAILASLGYLPAPKANSVTNVFLCPSGIYGPAASRGWTTAGGRSYGILKGTDALGKLGSYTARTPTTICGGTISCVPNSGSSSWAGTASTPGTSIRPTASSPRLLP